MRSCGFSSDSGKPQSKRGIAHVSWVNPFYAASLFSTQYSDSSSHEKSSVETSASHVCQYINSEPLISINGLISNRCPSSSISFISFLLFLSSLIFLLSHPSSFSSFTLISSSSNTCSTLTSFSPAPHRPSLYVFLLPNLSVLLPHFRLLPPLCLSPCPSPLLPLHHFFLLFPLLFLLAPLLFLCKG